MNTIKLILVYSVLHGAALWWREKTASGQRFQAWAQNWRTDAVTGIGLGFVIVVGSMCAAIYFMRWHLGYL